MKTIANKIHEGLAIAYSDGEIKALARILATELLSVSQMAFYMKDDIALTAEQEALLNDAIERLQKHEPIQYIFGHTEWRGLDLLVTPATLIPRPETAELIYWILESCDRSKPLHVLDIGTGSGCIAIALKKSAPLWQVIGIDISPDALEIAHENAKRNSVEVEWTQADILSPITNYQFPILDIIVSNPPYICHREKANMDARVLDYEPHSALFVPDDEPLLFYRRIAAMKSAKSLYFEINEAYGKEVCDMLKELGYTDIQLKHDIYGKPRMVFGRIEA
jgi:release factor glutamine methyltransferase